MSEDQKDPIAFYFDIFSPFGYLASTQIEMIAARHHRSVDWRPVLLGITVLKVMGMKPLISYPLKGPYLRHDMDRFAKLYGVPLNHHNFTNHNSLKAMRAFVWLKRQEPRMAIDFAKAMYARLWIDNKDITAPQDCAEEAENLGFDANAMVAAIATEEIKNALKENVDDAIANGVFGVPFFVADGEKFFGNDHIWMMEHWLTHGTFEPR